MQRGLQRVLRGLQRVLRVLQLVLRGLQRVLRVYNSTAGNIEPRLTIIKANPFRSYKSFKGSVRRNWIFSEQ